MFFQSCGEKMKSTKYSYQNGLLATILCSAYNNSLPLSQNFEAGSDILSKSSF